MSLFPPREVINQKDLDERTGTISLCWMEGGRLTQRLKEEDSMMRDSKLPILKGQCFEDNDKTKTPSRLTLMIDTKARHAKDRHLDFNQGIRVMDNYLFKKRKTYKT
jgi:hypothetical protein